MSVITSASSSLSLQEMASIKYFFENSTEELDSTQQQILYDQMLKVMKKSLSDEGWINFLNQNSDHLNSEIALLRDKAKVEVFFSKR